MINDNEKKVIVAAKDLMDLKHYKVLNGKDNYYETNKEVFWKNLEISLHNVGMCEAECSYCYDEANSDMSDIIESNTKRGF